MFKKFVGLATLLVAMAFASSVAMGTDAAKPAGFCVNVSFELDDSAGVFTYEKIPWKLLKAVPDPKYLEEKGVPGRCNREEKWAHCRRAPSRRKMQHQGPPERRGRERHHYEVPVPEQPPPRLETLYLGRS